MANNSKNIILQSGYNRRHFIRNSAIAGIGLSLTGSSFLFARNNPPKNGRIGIIGLDMSHSTGFTKALNAVNAKSEFQGYKVVAAYPKGSTDIQSSASRIPAYTETVRNLGVEIVSSIEELLNKVDAVFLETNDGRMHLEQAMLVIKAGKPMFIEKPVAASLRDAMAIFDAAKKYNTPVFSSSALRFDPNIQAAALGKMGKTLGADTYSPATLEKTHPDLYWYGIHAVEILFTVMGTGCKSVVRVNTPDTDIVIGTWADGRIGTVRGTRTGTHSYGGTLYGEKGNISLASNGDFQPLLIKIIDFFNTGKAPVNPEETLEMLAFMDAADESKRKKGASVDIETVMHKAKKKK
jgi:predicted dehydrogenase